MAASSKFIHSNMLFPDPDTADLAGQVAERMQGLADLYMRVKGLALTHPSYLTKDWQLFETMLSRYMLGDHRSSLDEKKATRNVADWTHRVNCELRHQTYIPIVWKD